MSELKITGLGDTNIFFGPWASTQLGVEHVFPSLGTLLAASRPNHLGHKCPLDPMLIDSQVEPFVLWFRPAAVVGVVVGKLLMPALATFFVIAPWQVFCNGQPIDAFNI